MHPAVALWTHPRSISTAFERVMIERRDFRILHEPFSYFYYVHGERASISQEYIDPDHPSGYLDIRAYILLHAREAPVFFKDMCAHCYSHLINDQDFLAKLSNTFLIRDPAKAIPSYYAMNKEVTQEEIGLRQLCSVFRKVADLTGSSPVVVDATDLEENPDGIMRAYCQALHIDFLPEAMSWQESHRKEWDIWKKWHVDAAKSTGITKNMETFAVTIDNSQHLKEMYDDQLPYYEEMYEHRLLV
jgi:hypothetical protein